MSRRCLSPARVTGFVASALLVMLVSQWGIEVGMSAVTKDDSQRFGIAPRQLSPRRDDHFQRLLHYDPYELHKLPIQTIVWACIVGYICLWLAGAALYWFCRIRPTADYYLPENVVVPQDLKGKWEYSVWGGFRAPGLLCGYCWCAGCLTVEMWYRAGWLHAALRRGGRSATSVEGCPGWPYLLGLGAYCCAFDTMSCCMPCGLAALRGGVKWVDGTDGGMDNIADHRTRFGIPHSGFSTFLGDCCLWTWCYPCVGVQEHRQILAVLKRPLQVAPAQPSATVGAPVQVTQVQVVGVPVPQSMTGNDVGK